MASTILRLGTGMRVGALGKRPDTPLELYDFESCPYCRKVREALSILDLDAHVYPCPKGGSQFREEVKKRGGKDCGRVSASGKPRRDASEGQCALKTLFLPD